MPELTVDGIKVAVPAGATLLEAARRAGREVPTLCHREGLRSWASCFLCQVEVADRDRFLPACATPAEEGMVVRTDTEALHAARRRALELLLSDHRGECEAPCRTACPARLDIRGMNDLLAAGREVEARRLVEESLALAGVIGRICPAYCRRACRRARLDRPLAIDRLHAAPPPCPPPARGELRGKAAVVGAGPAGLAAAFHLARAGAAVTLFEARSLAGGEIRAQVPPDRLPRRVLEEEIDYILRTGCEFQGGRELGRDLRLEELLEGWGAVLLATGAGTEALPERCRRALAGADRESGATPLPGLFAAGEALARTGRAAVRAVASGYRAAAAMAARLAGREHVPPAKPCLVTLGRTTPEEEAILLRGPVAGAKEEPESIDPRVEADLCLRCGCAAEEDCRLRELATAYGASPRRYRGERRPLEIDDSHPRVCFEPGKCIQCAICVRLSDPEDDYAGMIMTGRGFPLRVGPPFDRTLAEALGDRAEECVRACPTGALYFK